MQVFVLPEGAGEFSDIQVSYIQDGKVLFTKTLEDMEADGDVLTLQLTQQDTLRLHGGVATAEMTLCTLAGDVLRARKFIFHVGDVDDVRLIGDE